jgi:hypothetical protein
MVAIGLNSGGEVPGHRGWRSGAFALVVLSGALGLAVVFGQERGHENLVGQGPTTFLKWLEAEGPPVYKGFAIDDVAKVKVGPWKRYGVNGALVYLEGAAGLTTGFVWELEAGQRSTPVHHLFDGRVVVLSGTGETRFWQDPAKVVTARWAPGTLFPLPLNVKYQFINTGPQPARLFAVTNCPIIMDLLRNMDFIFNSSHMFSSRFDGAADYFRPEPPEFKVSLKDSLGYAVSKTNLVADVNTVKLYPAGHGEVDTLWRRAGGSGTLNHHYSMAFDSLDSHVEEFQPAVYEIAHRHTGGAYLMYLGGHGYTLLWPMEAGMHPYADGHADKVVRVEWHANTVFIPPTNWYHQHFNPSGTAARFIDLVSFVSRVYPPTAKKVFSEHPVAISYPDQDPAINKIFEEETARNGTRSNMPSVEEIQRHASELPKK